MADYAKNSLIEFFNMENCLFFPFTIALNVILKLTNFNSLNLYMFSASSINKHSLYLLR